MPQDAAKTAKRIFKKYRLLTLLCLLPLVPYTVVAWIKDVPIIWEILSPLGLILTFVFAWRCNRWYSKAIRSALTEELDLAKYNEYINTLKWSIFSPGDILSYAYATGDHQCVVNAVQTFLLSTKNKTLRFAWLSTLSASQFIMGDMAQLSRTLFEMETLTKKSRRAARLAKKSNSYQFFLHFLRGDPDACERECKKMLATPKISATSRLLAEWLLTTVYTERGEIERAQLALESFLALPKNLPVYREVAEKQLSDLSSGNAYKGLERHIGADPIPQGFVRAQKTLRRHSFNKKLFIVSICLILLGSVTVCVEHIMRDREWQNLSQQIETEVMREMPDQEVELLAYFDVIADDEIIDEICVLRRADGKLLVGTRFRYVDGDGTIYFEPYCRDMRQSTVLEKSANFDENYTVTYRLYSDKDDIPDSAVKTVEFKLNSGKRYFCVTKIEKK